MTQCVDVPFLSSFEGTQKGTPMRTHSNISLDVEGRVTRTSARLAAAIEAADLAATAAEFETRAQARKELDQLTADVEVRRRTAAEQPMFG